jgi:branched-chain amino acid transport system permease protein
MLELQLFVNGLAVGSLGAGLAMGFTLILGVHRFWHLAHGAVYLWAAYLTYILLATLGLPFLAVFILIPLIAGTLGGLLELTIYHYLRVRRVHPTVMLLASMGVYIAASNFAGLLFGFDPRVPVTPTLDHAYQVGAISFTLVEILAVLLGLLSFGLLQFILGRTRVGLEMRATMLDEDMATVVGAHLSRARLLSMVLGSALVGWPALLQTVDTGVQPSIGLNAVLIAAVAAIAGGLGSVEGAYLGALLVGVAEMLPLAVLPTEWQSATAFIVLIIFVLIRPTGFFGRTLWSART